MKTFTFVLSLMLLLGTVSITFAGNHPALTYPAGTLVTSRDNVQLDEVTPWHKGALHYATGVMGTGVWYDRCPAMLGTILNKNNRIVATLSNGKKVMVGCAKCIKIVEENQKEYQAYLF